MSAPQHPDDALMSRYVAGEADVLRATSLEQHLLHCPRCRERIASHVEASPLEAVWDHIREHAQAPATTMVERLLVRAGVAEPDALLVATAPTLRTSWLMGVACTLGFVSLAASYAGDRGLALFLILAPLVPVAGVALAYGPEVDPAHEVGVATPYSAARLLLLRTATVLATSLPVVLAAALMLPGLTWTTVGWMLPALAFTAVVLAASTWARPGTTAAVLAIGWTCAVGAATLGRDPAAVLAPSLLVAYAAIGVAAGLVLRLRFHHLSRSGSLS
jgi:anti-sigma factor RsiW